MHSRIRVIVADKRPIMREAVRFLLHEAGAIEVIGEADNSASLLKNARELSPDVVVVDERLCKAAGLPGLPTVILCEALPRGRSTNSLKFVEKIHALQELVPAIRQQARPPVNAKRLSTARFNVRRV